MEKVIIEISGGVLQNVYASKGLITKVQFVVLDHDNLAADTERPSDGYQWERVAKSEIQNHYVAPVADVSL